VIYLTILGNLDQGGEASPVPAIKKSIYLKKTTLLRGGQVKRGKNLHTARYFSRVRLFEISKALRHGISELAQRQRIECRGWVVRAQVGRRASGIRIV
jgi:hypothetical protein